MVGGGSNSPAWRQMFANVFNKPFVKANIGQDAASLGAAAVAAVGSGLWEDFHAVENIIQHQEITNPEEDTATAYQRLLPVYEQTWIYLSSIAELMRQV
jgi:xylulokinase